MSVEKYIASLSRVPNAPYLSQPAKTEILAAIKEMEISQRREIDVIENEFGVFVRIKRGEEKITPKLVDVHLDHPFFITDSNNNAYPFGNLQVDRICQINRQEQWRIPVGIFTRSGFFLGEGQLLGKQGAPIAKVTAEFKVPPNCHLVWKTSFCDNGEYLDMVNADDMVVVGISLDLIKRILDSNAPVDVTFMFGYIEEVKEISATGVAIEGLPWGMITPDWQIYVLEVGPAFIYPFQEKIIKDLGLLKPDVHGGPALRINDDNLIYGQAFGEPNLAEWNLIKVAEKLKLKYQHTVLSAVCDGSVFTVFKTSPNVAGIMLMNHFRHNEGDNSFPVSERVSKRDIETTRDWLFEILTEEDNHEFPDESCLLTKKLRHTSLMMDETSLNHLAKERKKTLKSVRPRLKTGYYFPERLIDHLKFSSAMGLSKI